MRRGSNGPQRLVRGRGASRRQLWRGHSSDLAAQVGPRSGACGHCGLGGGHYAGSGEREWGLKTWLTGRAGTAYLVGPPRGIGHLVSETFSWRSEQAQAEEEVGCQGESRAGAGPALGPEGGLWGDPGCPIPDSRSCPSQLHTLASALPSPHTEVFQLVGLSPQCMWGSGQPVAVGARRALPGALLL